jgi:hypothetical protein
MNLFLQYGTAACELILMALMVREIWIGMKELDKGAES